MEKEAIIKKMLTSYGDKLRTLYHSTFPEPSSVDLPRILSQILSENRITFPDPSSFWKKISKSDTQSQEFRESGNEFIQKQNYQKALSLYTKALVYAEKKNSKAYALALANRSVALSKLKMFSEAITDAQRCLDTRAYPDEFKLHVRQAKCHEELGEFEDALRKYEEARSSLSKMQSDAIQGINESIKSLQNKYIINSFTNLPTPGRRKQASGPHRLKRSRYISPKVEVCYEEGKGRYAVAKCAIDIGEEIVIDEAAARILQPWHLLDHCFFCLSHTLHPIPCEHCVGVVFCSQECEEHSIRIHSDFDCKLGILDSYACGSYNGAGHANQFYMAYKLLSVKGSARFFIEAADKLFQNKRSVQEPGHDELESYKYMCNLVCHDQDIWKTLGVVLFVLKLLENQGFFDNIGDAPDILRKTYSDERRDPQVFIGTLAYQFYLGILSNNHSISEVSSIQMSVKLRTIGLSVFPLAASIFNHACDPNTTPVYEGPYQTTIASRPIQPGENICHIYQGHFADTPKIQRQKTLRDMFHFECSCEACLLDYPLSSGLKATYSDCLEQELLQSLSHLELKELDAKHLEFGELIQEQLLEYGDVIKAMEYYKERIRIASRVLKRPHLIFVCGRAAISDCIFYLYSNRSKFIKESDRLSGVYNV